MVRPLNEMLVCHMVRPLSCQEGNNSPVLIHTPGKREALTGLHRVTWKNVCVQNAYFRCECFRDREKQQRRSSILMLGMVREIRRFISPPSEDTKRWQTCYYGEELRQMRRITLRCERLCILLVNTIILGYVTELSHYKLPCSIWQRSFDYRVERSLERERITYRTKSGET